MASVRTRYNSESKLASFLGSGRDLLPSELPTLRAVLRAGIKLNEDKAETKQKYPIQELALDVAKLVEAQWLKANNELIPPKVSTLKSIQRRIQTAWRFGKKKKKITTIEIFKDTLDKLFDITKCRCKIFPCSVSPPCHDSRTGKNVSWELT